MAHTLPHAAHGDVLPVVKIAPKFEGKGDTRHVIGTELTVLQNGTEAFAYIYLDNSFVTLHILHVDGMSDAEIDAVLDMVDFSTIR